MSNMLADGIDWVGYVDWNIRDFHGYVTERGSTYNAYLVRDDKIALIDTVKSAYASDLLDNIQRLTSFDSVDYVVCNHAEPDHSSALPEVMKAMPQAVVVCDSKCQTALGQHYDTSEWKFQIVGNGDSVSLGSRSLQFIETPMVHWPESMFTYIPENKILFSMDAFGQHFASDGRFDDEEDLTVIMEYAKTYYANIVMLFGKQIKRVLDRASALDIQMIAPSHGVIWRKNLEVILSAYSDWVVCKPVRKVLIAYDTMWQSTRKMAEAIAEGASVGGVDVCLLNVRKNNTTELATESLDAAVFAFGSPTLNRILMPQMAASLTYLKGLAPAGKAGFAFGSYGWSKGGAAEVNQYLEDMKVEILREPLDVQYVPVESVLEECRAAGRMLAEKAMEIADG